MIDVLRTNALQHVASGLAYQALQPCGEELPGKPYVQLSKQKDKARPSLCRLRIWLSCQKTQNRISVPQYYTFFALYFKFVAAGEGNLFEYGAQNCSHGARSWKIQHLFDESGELTLRISLYPILSPLISRLSDPESRRVLHVTAFGPLLPSDPHSLGLCVCRGKKHQCVIARLSR